MSGDRTRRVPHRCSHRLCGTGRDVGRLMSNRHVTRTRLYTAPFGTLRAAVTLTDTGKPLEPTDEPEHQLDGFCWCQPLVETDATDGSHLFIHRRSLDSPHIEAGIAGEIP